MRPIVPHIADDFSAAHREADESNILQIQTVKKLLQVARKRVEIIAAIRLIDRPKPRLS